MDAGHVWPRVGKGKKKSKLGKPTRRRTAQRHAAPQTILMKGARKTMKTKQRLDQDVLNPDPKSKIPPSISVQFPTPQKFWLRLVMQAPHDKSKLRFTAEALEWSEYVA